MLIFDKTNIRTQTTATIASATIMRCGPPGANSQITFNGGSVQTLVSGDRSARSGSRRRHHAHRRRDGHDVLGAPIVATFDR